MLDKLEPQTDKTSSREAKFKATQKVIFDLEEMCFKFLDIIMTHEVYRDEDVKSEHHEAKDYNVLLFRKILLEKRDEAKMFERMQKMIEKQEQDEKFQLEIDFLKNARKGKEAEKKPRAQELLDSSSDSFEKLNISAARKPSAAAKNVLNDFS